MMGGAGQSSPWRMAAPPPVTLTPPTSAAPPTATVAAQGSTAPARHASTTNPREVSKAASNLRHKLTMTMTTMFFSLGGGGGGGPLTVSGGVRSDRRCGPEFPLEDGTPSGCDGSSEVNMMVIMTHSFLTCFVAESLLLQLGLLRAWV